MTTSEPVMYDDAPKATPVVFEPYERVVVSCADHWQPVELVEVDRVLSDGECRVLLGCQGELCVDMVCEDARSVRWWKVEGWCRSEGVNTIPLYFDGPFCEIPKHLLDGEKGAYVQIRRCRKGPWVLVRTPEQDKDLINGPTVAELQAEYNLPPAVDDEPTHNKEN